MKMNVEIVVKIVINNMPISPMSACIAPIVHLCLFYIAIYIANVGSLICSLEHKLAFGP